MDERSKHYLVDWADNKVTGEKYPATWEPKSYVTKDLVSVWNHEKNRRHREERLAKEKSVAATVLSSSDPTPSTAAPRTPPKPRSRPRKVIESSAEVSPILRRPENSPQQPAREPIEPELELEIVESQEQVSEEVSTDSPLFEPHEEPTVEIPDPPPSYTAGEHLKSSSTALPTSDHPHPASVLGRSAGSGESQTVPVNFGDSSSLVVPDSQTFGEFSSSAPVVSNAGRHGDTRDTQLREPVLETPAHSLIAAAAIGLVIAPNPTVPSAEEPVPGLLSDVPRGYSSGARRGESEPAEQRLPINQGTGYIDPAQRPTDSPNNTSAQKRTQKRRSASPGKFAASEAAHRGSPSDPSLQRDGERLGKTTPSQAQTQPGFPSAALRDSLGVEAASASFLTQTPRPLSSASSAGLAAVTHSQTTPTRQLPFAAIPPANPCTPGIASSPIASVPSHSPGTLGPSAPPALSSFSSQLRSPFDNPNRQNMDRPYTKEESKAILMAKLKAKREAHNRENSVSTGSTPPPTASVRSNEVLTQPPRLVAPLIAEDQARRSPSAVPAIEPHPEITRDEMNTSERYETLIPYSEKSSGRRMSSTGVAAGGQQRGLPEEPQLSNSFVVPIALVGHQRDQYSATVRKAEHAALMQRFLAAPDPTADMAAGVEELLDCLRDISTHPDLANSETLTQYAVEPKTQAEWDSSCSGKFLFLRELLQGLRDHTAHIAIISNPGRVSEMLETFLTGIEVPHRRAAEIAQASREDERQGLTVTLLSVKDDLANQQPSPADLVIALDPTVSAECLPIKALMQSIKRPSLVTLAVPYSIEHIDQSISTALAGRARLRTLASVVWRYHQDAGHLEDDQLKVDEAAKLLAQCVADQSEGLDWPLPSLGTLESLDSQTESDIEPPTPINGSSATAATGSKRSADEDAIMTNGYVEPKRLRTEAPAPPATINPQNLDVTRISDSIAKPSQALSTDVPIPSDTEQQLRTLLRQVQESLDGNVQALSDLQYRFEEQRQQLHAVTQQRDYTNESARKAVERMSTIEARVTALRTERSELQEQIADYKARLLEHAVPERAALEKYRLAAEQAEAEKQLAGKRHETTKAELEYLRDMYQASSQAAQALNSQVNELQTSLSAAQNKASGEQAKLRQMGYDAQTKSLRQQNKQLKALLQDREAALKLRDEEIARLKEASRGRMGTRATSVPRSPRLGSPMKMDVASAGRGRGSRQASPVAGELRGKVLHPLRNG